MSFFLLTNSDGLFLYGMDETDGLTHVHFVDDSSSARRFSYLDAVGLFNAFKKAQMIRVYLIQVFGDESAPSYSPVDGYQSPPWFDDAWNKG